MTHYDITIRIPKQPFYDDPALWDWNTLLDISGDITVLKVEEVEKP